MSDAQLARIVQAVKAAVLEDLKVDHQAATPPGAEVTSQPAAPPAKPAASVEAELVSYMAGEEYQFVEHFETALRAVPALFGEIGSILRRIDGRPAGPGPLTFLAMLAFAAAVPLMFGMATAALVSRLVGSPRLETSGIASGAIVRAAMADLAAYVVFWLAIVVLSRKLFAGDALQSLVGRWVLWSAAQFGFYITLFRIWFRPHDSGRRIVPLDDRDAPTAFGFFVAIAAVVVGRSWISIAIADSASDDVIAAGLLIDNVLFAGTYIVAAILARDAIARWISNTASATGASALRQWFARNWVALSSAVVVSLSVLHAYGSVSGRPEVAAGLTATVQAALAMVLLAALAEFFGRAHAAENAARAVIPKLPGLLTQMVRVFIVLAAAVYFIKLWCVDSLAVMSEDDWSDLADYAFEPLASVFGAYLAVSYVNYLSARYLATHPAAGIVLGEDGEVLTRSEHTRFRTLVPILRLSANVVIIVVMGLMALSHLGFNITPLLAGASVIGLAISFGSQALVKDIVSGILFLAEDSFRVGEYIECGNAKGTVEGFTLRSVRLRHQDGQIYTVPFGQIGEITNYSRDWTTVKFNMSLDRDVDLEELRQVAKKVAVTLKADFKDQILEPLKVQGVKDVTDNAIVVQFKFTSLPVDPGEIERTARSRLLKSFKEEGIALSRPAWLAATATGA
ncbi:MAG: mechanosensitive ion channel family protein [Hyphomicrobiales bacterium]